MLREADENGDGVISREEFHDLFARQVLQLLGCWLWFFMNHGGCHH